MRIGIYNRWLSTLGGGEKHSLAIAEYLSLDHSVDYISHIKVPPSDASERFDLDLSRVTFVTTQNETRLALQNMTAKYDLFINASYNDFFESLAPHSGTLILFPRPVDPTDAIQASLDTYQRIWANSEFTRMWIAKYWERSSEVLYPPVDCPPDSTLFVHGKGRRLLSIGRFFVGGHNKKHLVMIEAFRQLVDDGLNDWSLYLVGGRTPGEDHANYLRRLRSASWGYPIHILPDASAIVTKRLLEKSAIYWHACGYGEDEGTHPSMVEHFGIATLEAMAWGCVPLVVGKGGQLELVESGRNGFVWQTLDELLTFTLMISRDQHLRQKLAESAIRTSRRFDRASFQTKLQYLVDDLLLRGRSSR